MKAKLQSKYASIAEKIIAMALESVDFSEDKAVQILNIVVAESAESSRLEADEVDEKNKEALKLDLKRYLGNLVSHIYSL